MPQDPNAEHARRAAELDADVTAQHIGAVYAEALLKAAEKAGCTEPVLEEFDSFMVDVLGRFPDLEAVLASRLVSAEDKTGLLDRLFKDQATPLFLNFLKVVSHHQRLDLLRAIHRQAHEAFDRLRSRVRVRVTTATPLEESLAEQIAARMKDVVGGVPMLERIVDPNLIGGVMIRVGDTVFDASVANQLKQLRKQMIDRSAHEIQSRRDRFRSPA